MTEELETRGLDVRGFISKHGRLVLLLLLFVLLIILLFSRCDSCSGRLSGIKNHLPFIGDDETKPDVADGCTYCRDNEEFRRQVVSLVTTDPEIAAWLKELICETDCSAPPLAKKKAAPKKKKTAKPKTCSDLGSAWSCVNVRKYSCVETRKNLCKGPIRFRCGRGCSLRSKPDPDPPDSPEASEASWEYHTFECEGTECDVLYSDVLTNSRATIVDDNGRPISTTGSGPERHFTPTRRVRVRVPAGTRVNYANMRSTSGQWAVSTDGARVEGSSEVSDPNFGVKHNNRPLRANDSRKMRGDWTFEVDAPEPTSVNPKSDNGAGTFNVR